MGTRIAVIADTHLPRGARRLPDRCVEIVQGADAVIHAGDFSNEGAFAEIAALGPPLIAVHGNVDEPALRAGLPESLEVELEGMSIAVLHDPGPRAGRAERLLTRFPDARCVIYGHTHLPEHLRHGRRHLFNPGSPTERRRAPHRSMGVIEVGKGRLRLRHIRL
jgi:hypothetical protein